MRFGYYGKQLEKFIQDNSPTILTAIGVVGTISTAILSGRASIKAADILREKKIDAEIENEQISTKEKVLAVWQEFLPPVGSGVLTLAAIIGANRVSVRRAAALAAAYSLSEKTAKEYKEKIVEKLGLNKEQQARDELAQKRVNDNPLQSQQVIITGNGEVMCYDMQSGRYFKSSMETLRRVQNDINQEVLANGYATLRDFYAMLNLKATPYSDEIGWTQDELLDMQFSTVLSDDGQPCIAFEFNYVPIRGYK